ncbi:MAG TPA: hypothetical protein VF503_09025 [Sphingobium sp.]|uniref:hypothetical protein n=1 Tax=Sphingobium sp. TaxID=1912891 RepID=UPI002ED256D5
MSLSTNLARLSQRHARHSDTARVNDAIRRMKAKRVPGKIIARELGVSPTRVAKIRLGRR